MVNIGVLEEIPARAVEVKVTSVCSPSFMKIYNKADYTEKLNDINGKLRLLIKHRRVKEFDSKSEPCRGDLIIIHIEPGTDCDLSAWWARGILGDYHEKSMRFNAFLVDYGNTIQVGRSDFTIVKSKWIANEDLSFSIGIHNLIPTAPRTEVSNYENIGLSTKWSDIAIQFTRDCIAHSVKTYFDYQTEDENKIKYGELYLILENEIVSLSDILLSNRLAVYLTKDVFRLVKSTNDESTKKLHSVDGGIEIVLEAMTLESPHRVNFKIRNGAKNNDKTSEIARRQNSKGHKLRRYLNEECQRVLVRSNIHCKRLRYLADAQFPVRIHDGLKTLSIIAFKRIQSYMCSAISKGLNVLAVGPPKCGKTLGYLMPIISSIALCKKAPEGNKPAILILCSSTTDVFNVKNLCSRLLECYTDIRCVAAYNGRPHISLLADIYNGCQILVTTPPFLVRFINQDEKHRKLLNFENLSHLAIDNIDVILEKYYESQLFAKHIIKARTKSCQNLIKPPLQIVAVSRTWSPLLNEFAKRCMSDSYVCIGSYMESAIFGCIKPKLHIVNSAVKMQRVKDILGDQTTMIKTMIVCRDCNEAQDLNEFLSQSYKTLVAYESLVFTDIRGISECWKATVSGLYPILICTDEVLVDLNITDVDWLIHYSVDLPSKTQFYFRFSTLMTNLEKSDRTNQVTIIADESNDIQLHGLVKVLERCGMKLPSNFMEKVMVKLIFNDNLFLRQSPTEAEMGKIQRIAATLDSRKKMSPICDNVKAFGYCPIMNSCPWRHCALAEVDTPVTSIKIGDSVKLIVTNVHNATHFTARIIEQISASNEVTIYSAKEWTQLSAMIQTYYSDKKNRRYRRQIEVGDISGLEVNFDDFQRVKVLRIVEKNGDDVPISVELKCVDTGAILRRISVTKLMEIPEDLANRDTHIVEVFLANLVPYDDEFEWNARAIADADKWFSENNKPHSYIMGKVCLHVADTLWVDPLEIRTQIIGYQDLLSASLKRHMIKLQHAVLSKNHLPQLYELCEIGMVRNAEGESIIPTTSPEIVQSDYISN